MPAVCHIKASKFEIFGAGGPGGAIGGCHVARKIGVSRRIHDAAAG